MATLSVVLSLDSTWTTRWGPNAVGSLGLQCFMAKATAGAGIGVQLPGCASYMDRTWPGPHPRAETCSGSTATAGRSCGGRGREVVGGDFSVRSTQVGEEKSGLEVEVFWENLTLFYTQSDVYCNFSVELVVGAMVVPCVLLGSFDLDCCYFLQSLQEEKGHERSLEQLLTCSTVRTLSRHVEMESYGWSFAPRSLNSILA